MLKYKEKTTRIWMFVFAVLTVFMLSLQCKVVFAEVNSVVSVEKNKASISTICSTANDSVGKQILKYNSGKGSLTFNNVKYSSLDYDDKVLFMEKALSATRKSGLGVKTKNKVYNFISDQDSPVASSVRYLQTDASADFVEAKSWIAPFTGPISTVMGVLCLLIFIFLSLSIIVDLAYLALPGVQLLCERGELNKRPFGVSTEAWKTNKKYSSENISENIITCYLKKRVPVIIVISICLSYLISGKIYSILVFFMDAFGGI